MYLRLGKTNINRIEEAQRLEFMVVGEVVNSQTSYEKPVLVKTLEELNIWFGTDFPEHDYLAELLEMGVTLSLIKPISENGNPDEVGYVDWGTYQEYESAYYNPDLPEGTQDIQQGNITLRRLPTTGEPKVIYRVLNDIDGKYLDKDNGVRYDRMVWSADKGTTGSYVPVESLGTAGINTMSCRNRDTLFINWGKDEELIAYTPQYKAQNFTDWEYYYRYDGPTIGWTPIMKSQGKAKYRFNTVADLTSTVPTPTPGDVCVLTLPYFGNLSTNIQDDLFAGRKTLAWKLDIPEDNTNPIDGFIVMEEQGTKTRKMYTTIDPSSSIEIQRLIEKLALGEDDITLNTHPTMATILEWLSGIGYNTDGGGYVYARYPTNVTYFYRGIPLIPDPIKTQNYIRHSIGNEWNIKFWTRVIGCGALENGDTNAGRVSVSIESLKEYEQDSTYRITITKDGYEEIYEGKLQVDTGEVTLPEKINATSRLLYCELSDPDHTTSLPIGSWIMGGSVPETYTPGMYRAGMEALRSTELLPIDFLLIPDLDAYDPSTYSLLPITKQLNTQALITNNPTSKNYVWNEIGDTENRLVYFYGDIELTGGQKRPGYYLYLRGTLGGKTSETDDTILYPDLPCQTFNPPLDESDGDYEGAGQNTLTQDLRAHKSNYLTYDGTRYYYETYFSGPDPISTAQIRFAVGKISREVEKWRWDILGERTGRGQLQGRFEAVLGMIKEAFPIYDSITLEGLHIDDQSREISALITSTLNDLVKSNITIDLTLNFKQTK